MDDIDDLNSKFLAHAFDRRQEGQSKGLNRSTRETDVTNERSFEDELGEEVLNEFLMSNNKKNNYERNCE